MVIYNHSKAKAKEKEIMIMEIKLTVVNSNLRNPDSVTVRCGNKQKMFSCEEFSQVEDWICNVWNEISEKNRFFPVYPEAKIYFNIDWDCDDVYYGKVEKIV